MFGLQKFYGLPRDFKNYRINGGAIHFGDFTGGHPFSSSVVAYECYVENKRGKITHREQIGGNALAIPDFETYQSEVLEKLKKRGIIRG